MLVDESSFVRGGTHFCFRCSFAKSYGCSCTGCTCATYGTLGVSLSLSGIECAAYGTAEEAVVNSALGGIIDGASSYSDHECADSSRRLDAPSESQSERRSLLTTSVSISTEVRDVLCSSAALLGPGGGRA